MAYRRLKPLASAALMVSAVRPESGWQSTHHDALAGRHADEPKHERIAGQRCLAGDVGAVP